ncbi:ABC transporter permease [uncultured Turicimonas sp.]|uniref:cell division protein FtsX n=1 Tax=uncultured Turicimonas sp. TaxID=1918607 RepID=UPI00280619F2|nr:ABC transporter permease [uncultured Turicimonas sp.]
MITVNVRAIRSLKQDKKSFWVVVALCSLAFCLLAHMSLIFISFYENHRTMTGDEISVFMEPGTKAEDAKKFLTSQLDQLAPGSEIRLIPPKDILEEDILKLIGKKDKIPDIYVITFPISTPFASIQQMVHVIAEAKDVSVVSANLDWIKKRYSLRQALALGAAAFGIPACALVGLLFVVGIHRLNSFLKHDQALLLMLGANRWQVSGPLVEIACAATLISSAIGSVLYFITTYVSVPLLEDAFEVHLLPSLGVNILICLFLTFVLVVYAAVCSYITAGRTKPLTF